MKRVYEVMATLAFVLALPGCGATVSGGGGGSDPGDPGESRSPSEDAPSAVAMRFSQWTPPPEGPSSFFDFSLNGATPDPNSLVLFYSNQAQACPQPFLDVPDPTVCDDLWQIILIVPPDRVEPGIIDLQDQSISEYRSVWQGGCAGGGSGSGPGIIPGKLTITGVGATSVETKLELDPLSGWEGQSGDYTATFCP